MDEAHRNAGLALRQAKINGGDQFVFFSSQMNDAFQDQIRMERMLETAILEREIELRVDRSFVTDIDTDRCKQEDLRGILGLCRGLGFEIIVEGVETQAEVMLVESMGCDAVQG